VDYDGSRTATAASTNYSLQNYANDVVATVRDCCTPHGLPVPTLVSESGRAIASHCSVLVFDVLGSASAPAAVPQASAQEGVILRNLRETLSGLEAAKGGPVETSRLQEAWNDAIKFRADALSAFRLGYMGLTERACAEQLTWACAKRIRRLAAHLPEGSCPEELSQLDQALAATYYGNLSVFRSAPDTWAIGQLFPVMPIHRLDEQPTRLGQFADLTCDSDGKLARFVNHGDVKELLELHELRAGEPYRIGLFLGGAYQEVMGNLHNLFGCTNAVHIRLTTGGHYRVDHVVRGDTTSDVLAAMEHDPDELLERLRLASENAIAQEQLEIGEAQRLIDHVGKSLHQTTYLQA